MTPAKMFDGDLWVLAADATKMAENAYKNGQADEREACAKVCQETPKIRAYGNNRAIQDECAAAIRARGEASIRSNT